MYGLLRDVRYAVRSLRRAPTYALAALATLALGIASTTAVFSTVNAALLRPLPYSHPETLYSLRTALTDGRATSGLAAPAEIARLHDSAPSIVRAAGASRYEATLIDADGEPNAVIVYGVTEGFFELFGLPMALGHGFTHEQHVGTAPGTLFVVLAHHVWRERFGGNPDVIGKVVRFAEGPMTVVGVAPPEFDVPHGTAFWLNLRTNPQDINHTLEGYLRIQSGVAPQRLRSELATVMSGLAREFPSSEASRIYVTQPLVDAIVGDLGPTLVIVLSATLLLLALACANVTNLILARGAAHAREMAIRIGLGATRAHLVRQWLTESMVLAVAGGIVGLCLAYVAVRLFVSLGIATMPRLETIPFDRRVLGFSVATLSVVGALFGIIPAARAAGLDVTAVINEGGRTASLGRRTHRMLGALIVAEIALAITLVAGAGWLVESFNRLRTSDPGFLRQGRIVLEVRLPFTKYNNPGQVGSWSNELVQRVRDISGVVSAGSASSFPLRPDRDSAVFIGVQGEPSDPNRPRGARLRRVGPGFFEAIGTRLAAGRAFSADDRLDTAPAAIVNRAFVKQYLAARDPLTAQIAFGYPTIDPKTQRTIVGVVNDIKYQSLDERPEPVVYLPQTQMPYLRQSIVVASALDDPAALVPAIRAEVRKLDPQLAIDVASVSEIVAATLTRPELGMTLMLLFAAAALVLAAIGIYGMLSYAAAQRLGEVATRIALGATSSNIFWLMMTRGHMLSAAGAVVGVAMAFAGGRIMSSRLHAVQGSDPVVLTVATMLVLLIATIATVLPAWRSTRVDPVAVMRSE